MTDSTSRRGSAFSPEPPAALESADGSSRVRTGSSRATPTPDDQATVITQRATPAADSSAEAVSRILHGRILPGERLGHFELLEYVGGGGMGKVFRALDTRLARSVALKILSPDHATDRETVLRFQNEAQSAARLDHENIARVYFVGEDRGLHFIAFEFIEGINVRDLVESRGPLPLAEAVSYTLQVADALAHASERNVVHRDIKPSNLLITPAGQAKLIDMGLARLREVDSGADLTASGVTLGTFDYISPEQARDPRNTDVRSDIYSLGCTFFFMLTGRPPFLGGTMLQKLLQHQADQPPDLRQFRPDLPEEVNRILRKMLAKDPRRRYPTPMELVSDLLAVARAAGLRSAVPGGRTWTTPAAPQVPYYYRHLPWIVPVLCLIAVYFALDHLWPYMPGPVNPPQAPAASGVEDSSGKNTGAIPAGQPTAAMSPRTSSAAGSATLSPVSPLPPASTQPTAASPIANPTVPPSLPAADAAKSSAAPSMPLDAPILPSTDSPARSSLPASGVLDAAKDSR